MNLDRLRQFLADNKLPTFRFDQAKRAFFVERLNGWSDVTTFPFAIREKLEADVPWTSLVEVRTQTSASGDTVKTLLRTEDGKNVEAVLMRHEDGRNTVCISSQIGCAMACAFCATGTMGWTRHLTADEMVDQVMHFARLLKTENGAVTNVVWMGMGEPFHNYDNVLAAIRILNDQKGFCLGARHMTVSTCGVVPGILRFADEELQVNLAISLHSAVDETRSKIMPVNRAYPLAKLMAAVDTYAEKTNRKVFFEYLLLKGVNDTPAEAEALVALLGHNPRLYHVNLIKYHDTEAFESTSRDGRMSFMDRLRDGGVPVTHRISFGEDIDAACGQLAVHEEQGAVQQGKEAVRQNRTKAPNARP